MKLVTRSSNHVLGTTWSCVRRFRGYSRRTLLTLAIETSCDDTAVAIVEKNGSAATFHFNERITANQGPLKGIHPIVALESHESVLAHLVQKALKYLPAITEKQLISNEVKDVIKYDGINRKLPDFVSVTRGPGIRSNLNAGLNVAKGLAIAWQVPLVGVHHMQAHALTPRLHLSLQKDTPEALKPQFPFLSLLVSGGHTLLVRSLDLTTHRILVKTSDYAIGDCLDKIARVILPKHILDTATSTSYGPLLEKFAFPNGSDDYGYITTSTAAKEVKSAREPTQYGWTMPLPFTTSRGGTKRDNIEFSFTGIETHALRVAQYGWNKDTGKFNKEHRSQAMTEEEARLLARESMRVCFQHIASRIALVLEQEESETGNYCKTLVISGGVAANKYLRYLVPAYLSARGKPIDEILAPPIHLCTDNAAMIGWTGCEMYEAGHIDDLSIRGMRKWSLENLCNPEREDDTKTWLEKNAPSP